MAEPVTRCRDSRYNAARDMIETVGHMLDFKELLNLFVVDRLKSSSALNQIDDQDDESNYEQEVDQAAANMAEQAKKPEH